MERIKDFVLSKYFLAFAFGAHAMVLFLLYLKFGINLSNEGEKYLQIALRLNFDNFREELHYLWAYSFYILFLTLFLKFGFSIYVILIIQYLISLTGFIFSINLFYHRISFRSCMQEFVGW